MGTALERLGAVSWVIDITFDVIWGTFTLHDLPVPDHQTVHDIMIRRGGRARIPVADYEQGRGWRMSDIELTEAEATAIANGADPLTVLTGPRIRLEIVRL